MGENFFEEVWSKQINHICYLLELDLVSISERPNLFIQLHKLIKERDSIREAFGEKNLGSNTKKPCG